MATDAPVFCINHPKTETLLRCNKCGRPFCIKCLQRMPVGYRCKECLNIQQAGYYTATPVDYAIVAVVGTIASSVGAAIALFLGGIFIFLTIFYGPAAGGIIAEVIRWAIQRRRAKYIWLVACATVIVGAFLVVGALPLLILLLSFASPNLGRGLGLAGLFSGFFNIGLWIYLVLAVSTVYARLRS